MWIVGRLPDRPARARGGLGARWLRGPSPRRGRAMSREARGRSTASLRSRVASAATREAAKPEVPIASMCSTSDWRRVEKARIASVGHALDLGHALDRLGPARRRGWPTARGAGGPRRGSRPPGGRCARIASPSSARQAPSGERARLATITWVWRCGSWARLVRWRKAAGDEALAVLADRAAASAAHHARLGLEVVERGLPARLVGFGDRPAHVLVAGEGVQEADALRAGEDQVVAGDRARGSSARRARRRSPRRGCGR